MPEFLLEVGCEELPAPWLPGLIAQLRECFEEIARRERLEPGDVGAWATPRRLVLRAEVVARQADQETPIWGPARRVARDPSGKWTTAALGFARKQGVPLEELREAARDPAVPDETYLLHVKRTEGRPAEDVLPGVIAGVLRALTFPKRMSWDAWLEDGRGAFPFGRPIRWLIALFGGRVVPFTIYAARDGARGEPMVVSGDATRGHRFLPRGGTGNTLSIKDSADLQEKLRRAYVILDPAERESMIRDGLSRESGSERIGYAGLVEEWRDLVEFPTVVSGRIPEEFQALPPEVLQTVLVHHQKYLPLAPEGRPASRFAAVTNTDGAAAAQIVRGMERVVVARLRDAAFFFQEDLRRPLEERASDLAGITFHRGLGSYEDKTERMVRLVEVMGAEMGLLTKAELEAARRAARLAKADLTTLMVREFPELQGVVGGIYIRAQGQDWPSVAEAVRWHYHPVSIEEDSPPAGVLDGSDATVFAAVSLGDKLDTLAGHFAIGNQPTGSSDPFGLRRAGQGAVRVLLDFWQADPEERRPSLRRLVPAALAPFASALAARKPAPPTEEVSADLLAFLLERLRYVLGARGFPADEVEAVLGAREPDALDDPHEAWVRLRALHRVRAEAREDFEHLAVAFKRAQNILGQAEAAPTVDPRLFREPAEHRLHEAVARLSSRDGDYEARLRALAGLRAPVDRFFDDVLVMAEDEALRRNRLALLARVGSLFYRVADISKLGG